MKNQAKKLTPEMIEKFDQDFLKDKSALLAGRSIAKNGFLASSEDPSASSRNNMTFSIEVADVGFLQCLILYAKNFPKNIM